MLVLSERIGEVTTRAEDGGDVESLRVRFAFFFLLAKTPLNETHDTHTLFPLAGTMCDLIEHECEKAERDLFFKGVWSNKGTIPEYTRVSSRHTPVWGSRVEIEAAEAFERVLAPRTAPQRPAQPTPDALPTVTPEKPKGGLLGLILSLFGGRK